MSRLSSNFISAAQRERIAEALSRAATARRRANGATRGLRIMLDGLPSPVKADGSDAPSKR